MVIAQVGFSTNLARLLDSQPDECSTLSGMDLVKQKVKLLSIMAGAFTSVDGNPKYEEYNIVRDIPSCRKLVNDWPAPVVFSGFEIGIALPYPATSIDRDYGYVPHHPLAEAYIHYIPPPHNRPTWDLTAVLFAVLGDRGYFDVSTRGKATVGNDGSCRFEETPAGLHAYLILRPEQRPRVIEALVQLSSQPPAPSCVSTAVKQDRQFPASCSISLRSGAEGWAPIRVTEMAAAALANRTACSRA